MRNNPQGRIDRMKCLIPAVLLLSLLVWASCGEEKKTPLTPWHEEPKPGKVVATIPVGHFVEPGLRGLLFAGIMTPDGRFFYGMDCGNNTVAVGQWPERVSITPDGRFVYVVNGDDTISVIER